MNKIINEFKSFLLTKGLSEGELLPYLNTVENNLKTKKYGLVWEEKQENMYNNMLTNLPILREDTTLEISKKNNSPINLLIEGDNLYSLKALQYTHKNLVDLIIIDPPYNRGKNDFIYNDVFVNSEDTWRHSKWLSFINKRLRLAQNILAEHGIIVISIDDNELCNLKLLCDEVFGPQNFVAIIPTVMNLKGNQDQFGFAGTHEYNVVYAKDKTKCSFGYFPVDEEDIASEWEVDINGYYKKGAALKATGKNAPREKRPNLYYPILLDENRNVSVINDDEFNLIYNKETKSFDDRYVEQLKERYEAKGFTVLLPLSKEGFASWRWQRDTVLANIDDIIIIEDKGSFTLYKKQRPQIGDLPTKKPKSFFYKPEYSSGSATELIKNMFDGKKIFDNPKPVELIKDFIRIASRKDSIVLDFFAGSGTTGQAVLELNAEDNGNRNFILCTNNENNICKDVTYERIKKVIEGYSTPKGVVVNGLNGNLKYYKVELCEDKEDVDDSVYNLLNKCDDLIAIKENCFNKIVSTKNYSVLENKNKVVLIYKNMNPLDFEVNKISKKLNKYNKDKVIYTTNDDVVVDGVEVKEFPVEILNKLKTIRGVM